MSIIIVRNSTRHQKLVIRRETNIQTTKHKRRSLFCFFKYNALIFFSFPALATATRTWERSQSKNERNTKRLKPCKPKNIESQRPQEDCNHAFSRSRVSNTLQHVHVYTQKGVFKLSTENKRFAIPVPKAVHSSSEAKVYTKTLVKGVFFFV